ncbi:MAG: phosphoribosylanthranilate isomerase [Candidatus Omnitrophota bacterium]|nr:phosphoribosylanthranilate isomerase [Candidatus Omnitrophota bacterium]
MVKVKICGLTNLEDAVRSGEYGADLLGFIFVEGTPRAVDRETVKDIISNLPGDLRVKTARVGLFKDSPVEEVAEVVAYCGLDHVQLHGNETPAECSRLKAALEHDYDREVRIIKVFKVKERILPQGKYVIDDYGDADYYVFDTFHTGIAGGTGRIFDWDVVISERDNIKKPFFIAGGLTPLNVTDAVRAVRPYGVDVSSGVEKVPGKKDENLLKEFIENAKATDTRQ